MPELTPRRVMMTADAVGGMWRYALELAAGFGRQGIETILVALGPRPSPKAREDASGVARLIETDLPLDWTSQGVRSLRGAARALAELARTEQADLAHLHAPALAGLTRWPVPVVTVAHSCLGTWWYAMRRSPLPADFEWRVAATAAGLRAAAVTIAPSHAFASALRAVYGPVEIAVVHNGRTPPVVPQCGRRAAVLSAGRLWDEAKNLAALDRAAARLGVPVYAAGAAAGPTRATVSLPHLHLLGVLDEAQLSRWHAGTAVYAAPARYEPFGFGVLEAAQAGMALVLSDIATFRELWDGAASFVPPERDDLLAETVRHLLADKSLLRRRAALARKRARAYGARPMVERTLALHRGLLRPPRLVSVA